MKNKNKKQQYRTVVPVGINGPQQKQASQNPEYGGKKSRPDQLLAGADRTWSVVQKAIVGLLVLCGAWIIIQLVGSLFLTGKGRTEADAVARVIGATEGQAWVLKLVGGLLVTETAGRALLAIAGAMTLGTRVKWKPLLIRFAILGTFFSLRPAIATILQRDERDGLPAVVEEIDPLKFEAFDSRTQAARIGVAEGKDGKLRAFNLVRGYDPKTGTAIREITPQDVERLHRERGTSP